MERSSLYVASTNFVGTRSKCPFPHSCVDRGWNLQAVGYKLEAWVQVVFALERNLLRAKWTMGAEVEFVVDVLNINQSQGHTLTLPESYKGR